MSDEQVKSASRRSFFRAATLGVGAAGAAVAGLAPTAAEAAVDGETVPDDGTRYQETAHVKKYYELARF
jgi:nitrous oxide reductase